MKNKRIFRLALTVCIFCMISAVPAMAAKVAIPQNVRWEGTNACWDEAEDAYQYQVYIYKNGNKQDTTVNTSSLSINLSGYMKEKGRYTFRVRVRDRISDEYGAYSESSDVYVQEKDQVTQTRTQRTSKTSNRTSNKKPQATGNPGPGIASKGWIQDKNGWWFKNEDGTYLAGGWHKIEDQWYYFNAEGYMQTGWLVLEGQQFYCYPDGSRAAGWIKLDEGYYYFDENGVLKNNE